MIDRIDHLVLTVRSVDATCDFYASCLGLERTDQPGKPTALRFGEQKINLHAVDHTFDPKARRPTAGSADFCLVSAVPLAQVVDRLTECGVPLEWGPVRLDGTLGPMDSIYFRDPDENLVEVSEYR